MRFFISDTGGAHAKSTEEEMSVILILVVDIWEVIYSAMKVYWRGIISDIKVNTKLIVHKITH